MMHSHLPSPRPLVLPSIGFAQNIAVGPEMLRHPGFEDSSDKLYAVATPFPERIDGLSVPQRERW
jgi:hypothetical protein